MRKTASVGGLVVGFRAHHGANADPAAPGAITAGPSSTRRKQEHGKKRTFVIAITRE